WYDNNSGGEIGFVDTNAPGSELEIKQRLYNNIQNKIMAERAPVAQQPHPAFSVRKLVIRAASIAAVLVIGFLGWRMENEPTALPAKSLVSVQPAKVSKIVLPDGSLVWLNAGSVLKYPKKFEGKERVVELSEGRAFFDIKHMADHPFILKTKNLNVTVLGTSFDVRSYGRESSTKVSVVSGKVGITLPFQPTKPAIMLVAKQEVVLSKTTNQVIKQPVRESVVNLWCKNELVFDQENLSNVFKAIEKKYNTRITVDDKDLLNERISITLGNQRLDTIMEILSFTKHFNYKMANDSTVVIK
ncbi:MAG TPA: FecR domain-containing protein, partial [Mucilaginibacter sp.]